MPVDEDKYPAETGRRRFVRGVVGSAALGTVSVGTAASINLATSPTGAGGGATQFIGIENTAGPAPRGMPIIPIEIEDGELRGLWPEVSERTAAGRTFNVAEEEVGGTLYSSSWFQYCGVQQYKGAQPDADADNVFRYGGGGFGWQADLEVGDPLEVSHFEDYREWGNGIGSPGIGKPGDANWRTTDDGRPLPIQVLRSPEVSRMANGEGLYSDIPGDVLSFVQAATEDNFIAWLNKCTHFCCVPGFKAYAGSQRYDAGNDVYCPCHQSIYDVFSPLKKQFTALPRPE
ncbi:MAG: ubiquinol-cytochrome c reductase iron-sulfur subunit [Haloarculaceae archaeon]